MASDQTIQSKMTSDYVPVFWSNILDAYDQTRIQTIFQTINKIWADLPDRSGVWLETIFKHARAFNYLKYRYYTYVS